MILKIKGDKPSDVTGMDTPLNYSTDITFGHFSSDRGFKDESKLKVTNGMKRILIIGSSGSGKSTLSRHLGARLSLPVVHLDNYFWHPGWQGTPRTEWEAKVQELIVKPKWVMDGNYRGTLNMRLQAADTAIFLDFPRWLCTFRAMKRRIQYRNKPRTDMAPGCRESLFNHHTVWFLRRIWDYPNRARPEIEALLTALPSHKLVFRLKSPRDVQLFLANVHTYSPIYMGWPLVSQKALT